MNQPTPAIIAQSAVSRLPRVALLLFCVAYVLPGFIGRAPWKNADVAAFGYMYELASGSTGWLRPMIAGLPPEFDALLPYWLGAWAIQLAPSWVAPDLAARVPFALLLALTLTTVWYGVYYLARSPRAQPLPFAFGGEAGPVDYARAMADGGLLALIACLGLAQLSHETTPALAQVAFTSLAFFGMAALAYRAVVPALCVMAGLAGLALSGAPVMATVFGAGGIITVLLDRPEDAESSTRRSRSLVVIAAAMLLAVALATMLDLWRWRIGESWWPRDLRASARLLVWFTWPAWPLAMWTIWRWRRQLSSRHVALPLWFGGVAVITTLVTHASDRSLLLGLPALATLAAFALPTLKRSVSALIDWFTLLFFSGCAVVIWVVWISMQTGVPAKPAMNVAKLAPGFTPSFSLVAFVAALGATIAWAWLVRWRAGRNRSAMWKSLVLPAAGAALCWLLMMTLWLPVLDYARSYLPVVERAVQIMGKTSCVSVHGLNRGQLAALRFHGRLQLEPVDAPTRCNWMIVDADAQSSLALETDLRQWRLRATIRRPVDKNDNILVFQRTSAR